MILSFALVLSLSPPSAEEVRRYSEDLAGGAARIELVDPGADAARAAAAAREAFELLGAESPEGPAPRCDRAVAHLDALGFGRAQVSYGGVSAFGGAPPGAPGWTVPVGFGTPGYPLIQLPLADCALVRVAAPDDGLRLTLVAADAVTAADLAAEVTRRGRRAGRALVEAEGARLFLEDPRFQPLFDGFSLDGWTETGGRYDGQAVWDVEDGAIVGRTGPAGEGGLIYTADTYTAFELELETWIEHPFDSGIFVHMLPRDSGLKGAQVTLDYRDGGEIAGIYSDGWLMHNPEVKERFRADAWNHVEVRVTGFEFRIEVWLNGELVTDYRLPPDATGYASAGRIGLQVHGGNPGEKAARFRGVRLRPLPVFGDEPAGEAWRDLFNGNDLEGWERHGVQEGYRVRDGMLLFPARGDGHLASVEDFRDFRLSLDFRTAVMANSGLFLRAARDGSNPAFSGCEVQILDDFNWEAVTGSKLKPWQFTGSLYGAVPPGRRALRPIGEWNTYELLYRGSRLAVALNGQLLYDVDTHALEPESGAPFAERAPEGFLGLQAHSPSDLQGETSLWLRNLRVQEL